jgi:3-oxoacyl-[acyl-carrier-protein] synthase-1
MPAASAQIVVTGVGMFTSVGNDAVQSASSVRAGINRFAGWKHFGLTFDDAPLTAAFTQPDLRDGPWSEKAAELLTPVLAEALFAAGCTDDGPGHAGPSRTSLIVGPPPPNRPHAPDDALSNVADELREDIAETFGFGAVEIVSLNHVSGLAALARGVAALEARSCDVCVVAAVDSLLHADFLHDLLALRRLKTPMNSAGLIPGEGAAALVLESEERARRRGAPILARIGSVALDQEPTELRPVEGLRAEALSRAVRAALAAVDPTRIHRTIVDLTGERWRSLEWSICETRCLHPLPDGWQLWHPADCWGDLGAASGAAQVVLAVRAFARGYGGPGGILVCCASPGGQRAAATVFGPERER